MLVNIIDCREDQCKFDLVEAVVTGIGYPNDIRPDGSIWEETDDFFTLEWKKDLSLSDAIAWVNELKFDAVLYIYSHGELIFGKHPTYGTDEYFELVERQKLHFLATQN